MLPAADLSSAVQSARYAGIAIAPDNAVTAIWSERSGSPEGVKTRTWRPGGSLGPVVNLTAAGQTASGPQIATAPDGTTTAVWRHHNGSNWILQAATRPPGDTFAPPVDISAPGEDTEEPQIATAPDGTTTVVRMGLVDFNWIIQAATRPPGGIFGPLVDLSATGNGVEGPQVATAPDGTTTVVWSGSNGTNDIVQAATRPPGGVFGPPVNLSAAGHDAYGARIATAPDGTATAVWMRSAGSNYIIEARTRPPGGSFGSVVNLTGARRGARSPQIGVAPDGTATAVWTRTKGRKHIIQARTRPPGGSFGSVVNLSAAGQDAYYAEIATAPDGTATVLWVRATGSKYIIQTRTRPPGGSFRHVVRLSRARRGPVSPGIAIAIAPNGTATAVWTRYRGSRVVVQQASTAPPGSRSQRSECKYLKLGGLELNKKNGTAKIWVKTLMPGRVSLKGSRQVKPARVKLKHAGRKKLLVRPRGNALKQLRRKGRTKVTAKISYRAGSACKGRTRTRARIVKLVKR